MASFLSPRPELIRDTSHDMEAFGNAQGALKQFFYFCLYVLGINFAWFHREWHKTYLDNKNSFVISSRRHAKSTWTQALAIWEAMRSRKRILVVMNSRDQTSEWMRLALSMLQDAIEMMGMGLRISTSVLKQEDVGDEIIQESIGRIALSNGSVITGKSLAGKIRGQNADIIICDDLLDKKMNMSFEEAEHIFRAVILGVREDFTKCIYVGTILREADILDKLYSGELGDNEFIGKKYPAIYSWEEKIVLWPSLRNWEFLMLQQKLVGELDFQVEYMLDPLSDKLSLVPRWMSEKARNHDLLLGRKPHPDATIVIGVDLQISPSSNADYTVLFALECLDDVWRLLDMERMRVGDGEDEKYQVNRLDEMARKYDAYEVKIESNGFQIWFANAFRETDHKFGLNIEDHDTRGEKHDKQIGVPSLRSLFVNNAFEHPWGDNNQHSREQIVHTREMMEIFERELAGWQYNIEKKTFESKARNDDTTMAFWFSVLSARGMIDEGYDQIGTF